MKSLPFALQASRPHFPDEKTADPWGSSQSSLESSHAVVGATVSEFRVLAQAHAAALVLVLPATVFEVRSS